MAVPEQMQPAGHWVCSCDCTRGRCSARHNAAHNSALFSMARVTMAAKARLHVCNTTYKLCGSFIWYQLPRKPTTQLSTIRLFLLRRHNGFLRMVRVAAGPRLCTAHCPADAGSCPPPRWVRKPEDDLRSSTSSGA